MGHAQDMETARRRAMIVFMVRSGQISAEEGARQLGISRKSYYQWESRALQAMTKAMEDLPAGRPAQPQDQEKICLQQRVAELEKKLFIAEKTVEVRDLLHAYELHNAGAKQSRGGCSKKKPKKKKRP
jgi:hypothetical protein